MNEVARAVEREFNKRGGTSIHEGLGTWYEFPEIVEDYATLQRLLKEAVFLLRANPDNLSLKEFRKRNRAFLAELPEGYGNE